MIDVRTFQCNMLQENCYVVSDDTLEAVVIDPGAFYDNEQKAINQYIDEKGLKLKHVLCTHAHFDHIFGANALYTAYGLKPKLHAADRFLYDSASRQASMMLGVPVQLDMPPAAATSLTDGQSIGFGSHTLRVLHTPGHSPGGVFFYCAEERIAFSGDTLFRMSVGRTDLQQGSWKDLMQSLKDVVAKLPADTVVYTGHGPRTRIGDEVSMNPYFL